MAHRATSAIKALVFVVLASAVLLAASSLAYGHQVGFRGNVTNTYGTDYYLRACDGNPNGNSVRGSGSTIQFKFLGYVYDKSGANDGYCGKRYLGKIGYHVTCERDGGLVQYSCGDTKREPW